MWARRSEWLEQRRQEEEEPVDSGTEAGMGDGQYRIVEWQRDMIWKFKKTLLALGWKETVEEGEHPGTSGLHGFRPDFELED